MAKHTPGPWEVRERQAANYDYYSIISKPKNEYVADICVPSNLSDAKLLAAAPELLEALKTVKSLWDKHGLGDNDDESEPVYGLMVSAIAKAEGRD